MPTGSSSTHFMPTQKRKNDRSRSSFFRAEMGESVQLARNFTMLSPVSCEMYLTPISSAKAVSRDSRIFCLATVASARCRAAASSRNLLTASSTVMRAVFGPLLSQP